MSFSSPIWRSPFRPFFLLATLYGPILFLTWILHYTGLVTSTSIRTNNLPSLWHQHEIIFGFAAAIIFGFILTALPSWADTREIKGRSLAPLVISWVIGRLAVIFSQQVPLPLVAILDLSFPVLFALMIRADLYKLNWQIFLGLAVIVTSFFIGNFSYYLGAYQQDVNTWHQGLRIGFYAMMFHCSITVGILAPIFTETALKENGLDTRVSQMPTLLWLSAFSIVALALLDLCSASAATCGTVALFSFLAHGIRLLRWHSFSIMNTPLVWVLHLGYLWLCVSLLLRSLENFGVNVGTDSWIHAFTIGGFGLMSLGLMTRVTLRHTGRELHVHPAILIAYAALAMAALLRVAIPIAALGQEVLIISAALWLAAYMLYLLLYGGILLTPSLPETSRNKA